MPAVRQGVATYNEEVYAVPVDGDVIIMLYREDLVEGEGLPTPYSWDDVMEIIDYFKDKDFTGDGEADYVTCFSTAESDIAGTMFWSIASTFLQTKGTSQVSVQKHIFYTFRLFKIYNSLLIGRN